MNQYQKRVFLGMCVSLLLAMIGVLYMEGVLDEISIGGVVIALIAYFLCVIPIYFYVKTTVKLSELKKL